jgi:hypothetical protein
MQHGALAVVLPYSHIRIVLNPAVLLTALLLAIGCQPWS